MSAELQDLLHRARAASGPDRQIDAAVDACLRVGRANLPKWIWKNFPVWKVTDIGRVAVVHDGGATGAHWDSSSFTGSLDQASDMIARVLPGWWWTCGLCALTGHASIGPDYNGPDRGRLIKEWPPEIYDHGQFNADLPPGDGIHRVCYALLDCMLQALIANPAGIPVQEG